MLSAATVFVCALELLGRSPASFPPVEFVDHPPVGVSRLAEAYVLGEEGRIVLITSTEAFQRARRATPRCTDLEAIQEIAGVLAHEEFHLRHGPDEEAAYDAQMTTLLAIGVSDNSPLVHKVKRAKLAVVAAAKRAASAPLVARGSTP